MNSLERYLGVIKGESVDFLPRLPILMQFAAEYIGSNYGAFASDHRSQQMPPGCYRAGYHPVSKGPRVAGMRTGRLETV